MPLRIDISYIKNIPHDLFILIRKNFSFILLFLIALLISLRNYDPGTYLTGWDTLHPEFNFDIYWDRIIDGVWQEHQGLGAVGSQAHAAEIPRILVLEFLSLFLFVNQLRYAFAFIMLILGPLGVYYFLNKIILFKLSKNQSELGAFAGGLLYLLNLGTVQHFYVPLEMFLVHYGLIGWLFYSACRYFETGTRRHILLFLLLSFLIIPQAHTPTLFYAYILNFSAFFGVLVVASFIKGVFYKLRYQYKINKPYVKTSLQLERAVVLFCFTLIINAFWLVPNIYFVVNHSSAINQSKIHHLFSEEAFLQNKEFGTIQHISILRNFLFNWGEHIGGGEFGDLLNEWKYHLTEPMVNEIGYIVFALIVCGGLITFVSKNKYAPALLAVFVICVFFLFNVNPPFGTLFIFLQNTFPIFKEAFRFPFTKFSILLMLTYGVYFGVFVGYLGWVIDKLLKRNYLVYTLYLYMYSLVAISLVWYAYPAVNGKLISPTMRVTIPSRYFDMFSYLEKQNDYGRVANLPIQSFWGWVYNSWDTQTKLGYQGAGFLWFGIKQPLLDREFDRWNILNEQYYREMSLAVYSENPIQLESTFDKFKIKWILLDESVISPGSDSILMFYPQIKELLGSSNNIVLEKDFGAGLKLYKYKPEEKFMLTEKIDDFSYSDDSIFKEYTDPVFTNYGDYVNTGGKNYPYLGITNYDENISSKFISSDAENTYFTNRLTFAQLGASKIDDNLQYHVLVKKAPNLLNTYTLQLKDVPGFIKSRQFEYNFQYDLLEPVLLKLGNNILQFDPGKLAPENYTELGIVKINPNKLLDLTLLKKKDLQIKQTDITSRLERCSDTGSQSSYLIAKIPYGFKIGSRDLNACITLNLADLIDYNELDSSSLQISVDTKAEGTVPYVCLLDVSSGLCLNKPLKNNSIYADLVGVTDQEKPAYFLRFSSQALLNNTESTVSYTNLRAYGYTPVYTAQLDLSPLTTLEGEFFGRMILKKDLDFSGNVTDLNYNPRVCSSGQRNFDKSTVNILKGEYIRFTSQGDSLCDSYQFPFAEHESGYILEVKARNVEGIPMRICLTNEYSKRCDLYVSLGTEKDFSTHYFLVPPMGKGAGYTVNISNLVFGSGISTNDLEYISLTPFPYNFIRNVHNTVPKNNNERLLVYNQAYEKGWVAICGNKLCNAKHVMVNNWSNGWIFPGEFDSSQVKIIFWPQILEYSGFILLGVSFLLAIKFFKKEEVNV